MVENSHRGFTKDKSYLTNLSVMRQLALWTRREQINNDVYLDLIKYSVMVSYSIIDWWPQHGWESSCHSMPQRAEVNSLEPN